VTKALAFPWCSLALTAVAVALQPTAAEWALTRSWFGAHEYHRLLTGHFVHYGSAHFWGDVLAFAFWAAAVERYGRRFLVASVGAAAVLSSLAVLAFCPSVAEYRGLSVVDCTLAVELFALLFCDRRRAGDTWGAALFAAALASFAGKTAYEFASGHAILAPDLGEGVALVPIAHVVGIGVGAVAMAIKSRSSADENRAHHAH
jgi:membrane associated rhomboid family serine protease